MRDPTFAAVAARLHRARRRDINPCASMPSIGQRVTMPTGRDAIYDGVVHDPHDGSPVYRVTYATGGQALFSCRGLLRVLAAADRMGAAT